MRVSIHRPEPAEYGELLASSRHYIATYHPGYDLTAAGENLINEIDLLPDSRLQKTAYYGFARTIGAMTQQLLDPGLQTETMDTIRAELTLLTPEDDGYVDVLGIFGSPRGMIDHEPLNKISSNIDGAGVAFLGLTLLGLETVEPAEHFLTDGLTAVYMDRTKKSTGSTRRTKLLESLGQGLSDRHLCITANSLGSLATNGLVRMGHRAYHAKKAVKRDLTIETCDFTSFSKLNHQGAALSLTEIDDPALLSDLFIPDEQGELQMNREALPASHTRPEGCPALGVFVELDAKTKIDAIDAVAKWLQFILLAQSTQP